jgi:tRNA nucleotidyltransferase (CCA-adding enzyme)
MLIFCSGRDPLGSINLINELGLYTQIFHVPEASAQLLSVQPTESSISVVATAALRFLVSGEATARFSLPALHPLLLAAAQPKAPMPSPMPRLYFATALTPYRDVTYTDAKGKVHQVSELVIREGLKLGTQNHYLDGIPLLFTATALLKDRLTERSRVAIGT